MNIFGDVITENLIIELNLKRKKLSSVAHIAYRNYLIQQVLKLKYTKDSNQLQQRALRI